MNKPADHPAVIEIMQPVIADLESALYDTSCSHEILGDLQRRRNDFEAQVEHKIEALLR